MPNYNYNRGRAREYQVVKALKDEGYELVVRTAGSRSPVDVIAIKDPFVDPKQGLCAVVKLVQVKSSKTVKKFKSKTETIETDGGSLIVERWTYPTRSNAKNNRKQKKKVGK